MSPPTRQKRLWRVDHLTGYGTHGHARCSTVGWLIADRNRTPFTRQPGDRFTP